MKVFPFALIAACITTAAHAGTGASRATVTPTSIQIPTADEGMLAVTEFLRDRDDLREGNVVDCGFDYVWGGRVFTITVPSGKIATLVLKSDSNDTYISGPYVQGEPQTTAGSARPFLESECPEALAVGDASLIDVY